MFDRVLKQFNLTFAGKMDDVLDSVRFIHMHGDLHRRVPVMVSILLRSEDSTRTMASIAGYKRFFHPLQEVCSPGALQTGTGEREYSCVLFNSFNISRDAIDRNIISGETQRETHWRKSSIVK